MKNRRLFQYSISVLLALLLINLTSQVFPQATESIKIVCFGNSTTAARKTIDKVYPERLKEILSNAGIPAIVYNAGLGGSHTGSFLDNNFHKIQHAKDRFDTAVLAKNPNWLIIAFGINDAWKDKGQDGPNRIPIEAYQLNLNYFIQHSKEKGIKIILLTPNPIGKKYETWRSEELAIYSKATKKIARKNKIALVDEWELFYQNTKRSVLGVDQLLLDGLHPNDQGHAIVARAIANIIIKSK
jgi:lysophospholipase L1-like esterase